MKTKYKNLTNFINKNFTIIIITIIIIKILLLIYLIKINWLAWDKTIWYNAILTIKETGKIPYLNYFTWTLGISEYPISFTYFLLIFYPIINLITKKTFFLLWGTIQIIFDIATTLLLIKIIKNKKRILFGFILAPTILLLSTSRFDLIPTFLTLLTIYLLSTKKNLQSAVTCAIAIFMKIYPIAILISFHKKLIKNYKFITTLAITSILLNFPLIKNPKALLYPLKNFPGYRAETLIGIAGLLGIIIKNIETINKIILLLLILLAFLKAKTNFGKLICIIISLLLTSKALSPQWNIWLLPLLILTQIPLKYIIIFDLITIIEFPFIWQKVFFTTNFDSSQFNPLIPANLTFIILNMARYGFLIYFYIKCLKEKNLINPKTDEQIKKYIE